MKIFLAVNERGLRVGEDHPAARLTNGEVDLLLALREEGWSYGRLAEKFDISKSGARKICKGQTRCQYPVRFKAVHVSDCV
jgi:hypothetical protein